MPGNNTPDQKNASPAPSDFDAIQKLYEAKKFQQALEQINLHLTKTDSAIAVAILRGQKGICLENLEQGDHAATEYQHFINFFLKNPKNISNDINALLCNAIYHNAAWNYSQKQYAKVVEDLNTYFKEINPGHRHENTQQTLLLLAECCHITDNNEAAFLFIGRYLALGFPQTTPFIKLLTALVDEQNVPDEHSKKLISNRTNAAKTGIIIDVLFRSNVELANNLFLFFVYANPKFTKYNDVCLNINENYRNILISFLDNPQDPNSSQLFKKWQQALSAAASTVQLQMGTAVTNDYFPSPALGSINQNEEDPLEEFELVDDKETPPTQLSDSSTTNSSIRDSARTDTSASPSMAASEASGSALSAPVSMVASSADKTTSFVKTNNGSKVMNRSGSPNISATAANSPGFLPLFNSRTPTYRYHNPNVNSPHARAAMRRAAAQNQQIPSNTGAGAAVVAAAPADVSHETTAGQTPPPFKL